MKKRSVWGRPAAPSVRILEQPVVIRPANPQEERLARLRARWGEARQALALIDGQVATAVGDLDQQIQDLSDQQVDSGLSDLQEEERRLRFMKRSAQEQIAMLQQRIENIDDDLRDLQAGELDNRHAFVDTLSEEIHNLAKAKTLAGRPFRRRRIVAVAREERLRKRVARLEAELGHPMVVSDSTTEAA